MKKNNLLCIPSIGTYKRYLFLNDLVMTQSSILCKDALDSFLWFILCLYAYLFTSYWVDYFRKTIKWSSQQRYLCGCSSQGSDGVNMPMKSDVGDVSVLHKALHLGFGNRVIHGVSDKPSSSASYCWRPLSGTLS